MQFQIIKANIVNIAADAIVLPANEQLKEGSGASEAIFAAAGRKELTKACQELGHCPVGSAIPTPAYDLEAKFIIHAVVPRWVDGTHSEYDLLSSAYLASLNIADIMGCSSIAFPLLASGNNGFNRDVALQVASESINRFSGENLNKVYLIVYGDHAEEWINAQGYTITIIPDQLAVDIHKREALEQRRKLIAEGKNVAQKFVADQLAKAFEWLKDEDNREKLIRFGIQIVKEISKNRANKINNKK